MSKLRLSVRRAHGIDADQDCYKNRLMVALETTHPDLLYKPVFVLLTHYQCYRLVEPCNNANKEQMKTNSRPSAVMLP